MVVIHIERGRIIDTDPAIVSCMWSNWEIYDALLGRRFKIERVAEKAWRGKYGGLTVKVELVDKQEGEGSGTFKYLVSARKFGIDASLLFNLNYSATADGRTSVFGIAHAEAGGFSGLVWKFFAVGKVTEAADQIIDGGEKSCIMISHDYDQAIRKISKEQRVILDSSLAEAKRAKKASEVAARAGAEALLTVVPLDNDSLIRFEIDVPRPRTIREVRRISEARKEVETQWNSIVGSARRFSALSRGGERSAILAMGEEFYSATIRAGHFLYSSYLSENMHSYLSALMDSALSMRVRIQPDGREAMMPWEILHNGEHFIALTTGLSRTTLSVRKAVDVRWGLGGVLLVGSNPLGDLQATEQEVSVISEAVTKIRGVKHKVLTGSEATRRRLVEELGTGDYQVLHYAGHSVYDQANPRLSHLLLYGETKLMADELALLSAEKRMYLVFLNSCSTGTFQNIGFSSVGLAHAFVTAGVPYVLGMMWDISDLGASVLAEEFYRQLLAIGNPVEALRRARVEAGGSLEWKDPVWAAPTLYTA
jgi:hypothetical protein